MIDCYHLVKKCTLNFFIKNYYLINKNIWYVNFFCLILDKTYYIILFLNNNFLLHLILSFYMLFFLTNCFLISIFCSNYQ